MPPPDNAQRSAVASRLRLDAATAEVMAGFERAGVAALVLKGPALRRWLYTEETSRTYMDCDLLVAPADLAGAEDVLAALGYKRYFDDRNMPSWWREHAGEWVREGDGVTVDLHRTLPGVGVDSELAWPALAANPDRVLVDNREVPTLSLAARALHVVLHAAQHGAGWSKPLDDLRRALRSIDETFWSEVAELASRLQATDAFTAGLRLDAAGAELADRLELPSVSLVDTHLRAASAPPEALTFERLARAPGMRAKATIALRKLAPPAEYLRYWDTAGSDGRLGLVRAYLRRVVWILRRAPRALAAWWRARRAVERETGRTR